MKNTTDPSKEWMNIISLEAACKKNGTIPAEVLPFKDPTTPKQIAMNAVASIWEIIEAINSKEFKKDYKNRLRWFPVFKMTETGLVFSSTNFGYWDSNSDAAVGAPFAIESDEKAEFIGKTFISTYAQYIIK